MGGSLVMTFEQGGVADADEPRTRPQVAQVGAPRVAHPGPQSPNELVDELPEGPFVGHTSLDAFGYELLRTGAGLPVPVGALHHRRQRPHGPVDFEAAPLENDQLPGTLRHPLFLPEVRLYRAL